jgi:hypothetical protein
MRTCYDDKKIITERLPDMPGGGASIQLIAPRVGWLVAFKSRDSLHIDFVRASAGRKAGQALLRRTIPEAAALGSPTITADITTREGLHACQAVFGRQAIAIDYVGDWGEEMGSTYATLNYQLGSHEPAQDIEYAMNAVGA